MIVATTLRQAEKDERAVVSVADDTDVVMLLLYNWQERHGDVFFFPEKKRQSLRDQRIL